MTAATSVSGDPARLENLPVEVRAEDFALIARATVATAAETIRGLTDDSVYLSVTLPDGGKVGRMVSCSDAPPQTKYEVEMLLARLPQVAAFLRTEAADRYDGPDQEVRHGIRYAALPVAGGTAFRGATLYRGTGDGAHDPLTLANAAAGALRFVCDKAAPSATLQIRPMAGEPVNVVLPRGATIRAEADGDDWVRIDMATGVTAADDIIRLRAAGQVDDVAALLKGLSARDAAKCLRTNPAAGAVIGYGLLRTAAPDAMAEPFANAAARWPDDPDALTIAAEVAARLARHDEAVTLFCAAVESGLPAYSFGLNYAADRLRAYGPRAGGPDISDDRATRLAAALDRIYPFANQQEASILLTCYTGDSPAVPSMGSA